jgi:hypothetical protein
LLDSLQSASNVNLILDLAAVFKSLKRRDLRLFFSKYSHVFENLNWHYKAMFNGSFDTTLFANDLRGFVQDIIQFLKQSSTQTSKSSQIRKKIVQTVTSEDLPAIWAWLVITTLKKISRMNSVEIEDLYSDWMLEGLFENYEKKYRLVKLLKLLLFGEQDFLPDSQGLSAYFISLLHREKFQTLLGINHSGDSLWYNRESMEDWIDIWNLQLNLKLIHETCDSNRKLESTILLTRKLERFKKAVPVSDYKVEKFIKLVEKI